MENNESQRSYLNRYQWILIVLGILAILAAVVFRMLNQERGIGSGRKGGGMGGDHPTGLVEQKGEDDGTTVDGGAPNAAAEKDEGAQAEDGSANQGDGEDNDAPEEEADDAKPPAPDEDKDEDDDRPAPPPVGGMKKDLPITAKRNVPPRADADVPQGKVRMKGSEAQKKKGFFGSGSISGNVIFLVDISGSMAAPSPEGMRRIDLLRGELLKVLKEKLDNVRAGKSVSSNKFVIIPFDDQCSVFPPDKRLSFGNQKDLQAAIEFVEKSIHPRGGTNMMGAWQFTQKKVLSKYRFDTVYFLSDGEDPAFEAKMIKKLNIRIMTFSLGVKSSLLESIAKQHRGLYSEIY